MSNEMTNPNPNPSEQEPFIPPRYMLILAGIGFLIAVVVRLTQAQFSVVGWGGLVLGILSLIIWGFMAPDQARSLLTGRTARYGGTSVLVTVLFLAALVAVYAVVKSLNLRVDLTQKDTFSLNEQTRPLIAGLAVEPNVPAIKIYAFYGSSQASRRDQDTVLLDDYVKTSNSKISYEFVDPDRNPVLAQKFNVTRAGQIVVTTIGADGEPVVDQAQTVNFLSQEDLSNAILRVAASGDFRAYFVAVDGALKLTDSGDSGLSRLNDSLTKRFNWKTSEINLVDLTSPQSEIKLDDPTADGQALVIVGGNKPLPDAQLKVITDYLDKGGDLVLFAAPLNADATPSLATANNLSTYLYEKYGVRFTDNMILDQTQAFQTAFAPVATDFDPSNFVTSLFASSPSAAMIFEQAHSIEVAPSLPSGVTVTELAKSSANAYAKTDPAILTQGQADPVETDPKGPFVLAVAAENNQTGSRIVLFGSLYTPSNLYATLAAANVFNVDASLRSIAWVSKFDAFFSTIPQAAAVPKPQDSPIFVDAQATRNINLFVVFILPFGVLLAGAYVWWRNREPAR